MTDEMTLKNTKNEILEAYHEALQTLKETKKVSKQELKTSEEKKETVAAAINQTPNEIVKNTAELKLSLVNSLEDIEEKLLASYKQLTTLQEAIEIQTKTLAEINEIQINTDTLAALLFAQHEKSSFFSKEMQERQQNFEQEMVQKRTLWKKEQEDYELARKDYESQTKKIRERDEEEYSYQRDLLRQKERDHYTAEKEALEKELIAKRSALENEFQQRADKIISQEQEFNLLKEKAEKFPAELQQVIEETSKAITERLSFKFDYETQLAQKEVDGERKLYQQMISALEAKVALLEGQMAHLVDKTNQANLQVQDIAIKAIDGASRQRYPADYTEKALEQTKSQ